MISQLLRSLLYHIRHKTLFKIVFEIILVFLRRTLINNALVVRLKDGDLTGFYSYKNLVDEEIDTYCNIEVTEELREGGISAHKSWEYWFKFLQKNVWRTSLENEIVTFCDSIDTPRILSLGCGYGGLDVGIARLLKEPYEIVAVDINPRIFDKASKKAQDENLNITFKVADLNFVKIKKNAFDVVYAHASLHHILNLENLFYQVYQGLKKNGRFIVLDIIGKPQVHFWRKNRQFAIDLVNKMPSKYRPGVSDARTIIPSYRRISIQIGMEGIRQEQIERLILKCFSPIKMFKYGSFMRLICTDPVVGPSLNPDVEEDRKYLEYLSNLDVKQVKEGNLRPTELFAVFEKKPTCKRSGWFFEKLIPKSSKMRESKDQKIGEANDL